MIPKINNFVFMNEVYVRELACTIIDMFEIFDDRKICVSVRNNTDNAMCRGNAHSDTYYLTIPMFSNREAYLTILGLDVDREVVFLAYNYPDIANSSDLDLAVLVLIILHEVGHLYDWCLVPDRNYMAVSSIVKNALLLKSDTNDYYQLAPSEIHADTFAKTNFGYVWNRLFL